MKNPLVITALVVVAISLPAFAQQTASKPPVGVPNDAKLFNGKWYCVYLEKGGWKRAREKCAQLRGQLAIIPDEPTQVFIRLLAERRKLWLGGTDEKVSSLFVWSDGTQAKFEAWSEGQPLGRSGYDYIYIGPSGHWFAAPENDSGVVGYICEWKAK